MLTLTKTIEFDYGHRLQHHEGKCRNAHGHRAKVELFVYSTSDAVDSCGRLVDFDVIKGTVGKWITDKWDHGMILEADDPLVGAMHEHDCKTFVLPEGVAPSAENLAMFLHATANRLLAEEQIPVRVNRVLFWETPTSCASYAHGGELP